MATRYCCDVCGCQVIKLQDLHIVMIRVHDKEKRESRILASPKLDVCAHCDVQLSIVDRKNSGCPS